MSSTHHFDGTGPTFDWTQFDSLVLRSGSMSSRLIVDRPPFLTVGKTLSASAALFVAGELRGNFLFEQKIGKDFS